LSVVNRYFGLFGGRAIPEMIKNIPEFGFLPVTFTFFLVAFITVVE